VIESTSPAHALLVGLGVSPDAIARRLVEILPIRRVDEDWLRATAEKFPRLTFIEHTTSYINGYLRRQLTPMGTRAG
jgi:hypothetical protein